ncbi:hypothetical protein E2C01_006561 [Portunus trituberculatus]|uniref:Uncharacterized protein n=1 Tax=Portunus trituberculatus TaxID=210409 RepID=A0A5B7CYH8_PORTR|nr:hypothetical protein [Portunus trituberculatus]
MRSQVVAEEITRDINLKEREKERVLKNEAKEENEKRTGFKKKFY